MDLHVSFRFDYRKGPAMMLLLHNMPLLMMD